jgi:hypothetical protein
MGLGIALAAVLFLGASGGLAQAVAVPSSTAAPLQESAPKTLRVLFIGNSYTFFNNLPYLLESIAASQKEGPRFETEVSLSGGKTLQWHWEQQDALAKIRRGGWDFVVLQEFSTLGYRIPAGGVPKIAEPEAYFAYARRFHEEIVKVGAQTVLYATWARHGYPEQQRRLDHAFTEFAREANTRLVPAGLAWTVTMLEAPGPRGGAAGGTAVERCHDPKPDRAAGGGTGTALPGTVGRRRCQADGPPANCENRPRTR